MGRYKQILRPRINVAEVLYQWKNGKEAEYDGIRNEALTGRVIQHLPNNLKDADTIFQVVVRMLNYPRREIIPDFQRITVILSLSRTGPR